MTRLLSVVLAFGIGMATVAATHEAKAQVVYSTYYAPAPVTAYYAPTTTYYAPAATTAYYAPAYYAPTVTSYYAPTATSYYAPAVTSYYAPETTAYYAPAPVTAYYAPAVSAYYAPSPVTSYYAPAPVVVRARVYVPGEPVRNFFRAL